MQLCENLKYLRQLKGLTQKEIAARLNVEPLTYGRYERGEREPPISVLIKLSAIYEISIDEMVGIKFRASPFQRAALDWQSVGFSVSIDAVNTVTIEYPFGMSDYHIDARGFVTSSEQYGGSVHFRDIDDFAIFTDDVRLEFERYISLMKQRFYRDQLINLETKKAAR